MGIILDSTVFIGAERQGLTVSEILHRLLVKFHDPEIALAAITAAELIHGVWRAERPEIRSRREDFIEEVFARVPVRAMTLRVARIVGRVDAQSRSKGIVIPTADLIIGATALDLNFAVATANIRHFRLIPGLKIHLLKNPAPTRP